MTISNGDIYQFIWVVKGLVVFAWVVVCIEAIKGKQT